MSRIHTKFYEISCSGLRGVTKSGTDWLTDGSKTLYLSQLVWWGIIRAPVIVLIPQPWCCNFTLRKISIWYPFSSPLLFFYKYLGTKKKSKKLKNKTKLNRYKKHVKKFIYKNLHQLFFYDLTVRSKWDFRLDFFLWLSAVFLKQFYTRHLSN